MKKKLICLLGLLSICPVLAFAAPDEAVVQGLYEGTSKDAKVEARVVAQGNGDYNLLLRQEFAGKVDSAKLEGKTDSDSVRFSGKAGGVDWKGEYNANGISLTSGKGDSCKLSRVERKSPTLGKQPPQGATVYLDGKSLANLKHTQGGKQPATDTRYEPDGSYKIPEHGIDTEIYPPDFEYDAHIEFKIPLDAAKHGWARNSGWFFLPNMTKISIVDSFGEPCPFSILADKEREKMLQKDPNIATTFQGAVLGGIYGFKNPDKMEKIDSSKGDTDDNRYPGAALPPLEWQTLDLEYRLHPGGKPHLTAYLNGVKIHDNVEMDMDARKGVFHFRPGQVFWRNFWVVPMIKK